MRENGIKRILFKSDQNWEVFVAKNWFISGFYLRRQLHAEN